MRTQSFFEFFFVIFIDYRKIVKVTKLISWLSAIVYKTRLSSVCVGDGRRCLISLTYGDAGSRCVMNAYCYIYPYRSCCNCNILCQNSAPSRDRYHSLFFGCRLSSARVICLGNLSGISCTFCLSL